MEYLKQEFFERLKKIDLEESKNKNISLIFDEIINKCVAYFVEREAKVIIKKSEIIGVDSLFLDMFGIKKRDVLGRDFASFFSFYEDIMKSFLENVDKKGFYKKSKVYLEINNNKFLLDIEGEKLELNRDSLIVVSFKKKEFDDINYKLSEIERKVANLVLRVKDFRSLMSGLLEIFIDSKLFDFGWVAKIEKDIKKIIPIATTNSQVVIDEMYDFYKFEHILDVLLEKKDLIFENNGEYKTEIIFPIFKKWDYKNISDIAYIVLAFSKKRIKFGDSEINRLREVIYKINLAVVDIFMRESASIELTKDILTNLPNRNYFIKYLDSVIEEKIPFGLILIDIDKLRKVNDVLGFWAGDEVIKKLANYLRNLDVDFVSRIGNDEFGLIVKGNKKNIYEILDKLVKFNDEFLKVNGSTLYMPISIGVSFYPEDGFKKEEVVLKAENALKLAKKKGGKRIEYANKNLTLLPKDYLELEKELKEAIEKKEYVLYYQPIIDLNTKKVWGVEALLRWKSKKRGIVSPAKFIPILEESGLINEVGDFIIDDVCKVAKEFEDNDLKISFSMNISVTQLLNKNIANEIISKIKKYNVKSENVIVEITESVLMENIEQLKIQIDELEKNGVKIEIDDFGTGYSSLSYLKKLPVYALKIDREFIKDILVDEEDLSIVKAIVSMAKALHKNTIAEGVENKEQLLLLKEMEVDKIQGFYFAKPMEKSELRKFLKVFDFNKFL